MKFLKELINRNLSVRTIGFDDAPFDKYLDDPVKVVGVVCAGTRFEGMLLGEVQKDGTDATYVIADMLLKSKFREQVHLVLLDGLAFGGFNLIDLPELAILLDRPCVAVMRKRPDMEAVKKALKTCDGHAERFRLLEKAGDIYREEGFCFQVMGEEPGVIATALKRITDKGNVPEALRLAHLIGSAVITGQSNSRA